MVDGDGDASGERASSVNRDSEVAAGVRRQLLDFPKSLVLDFGDLSRKSSADEMWVNGGVPKHRASKASPSQLFLAFRLHEIQSEDR